MALKITSVAFCWRHIFVEPLKITTYKIKEEPKEEDSKEDPDTEDTKEESITAEPKEV